jgi:hypothetical protein
VAKKTSPRRFPYLSEIERRRVEALRFFVGFAQGEHDARELARFALRELGRGLIVGLGDEQIKEVRSWMLGGLCKMANGQAWEIRSEELGPFAIVHGPGRSHYEGGPAVPKLLLSALLDGANWRIGWCAWPDCRRLFVRKGQGEYCSRKCSQRMRTRRFRDPEFRKQETASKVRIRAAIEPAPKSAKRTNRRSLGAALTVGGITRKDIAQSRRRRKEILEEPENTWRADIEAARREKED